MRSIGGLGRVLAVLAVLAAPGAARGAGIVSVARVGATAGVDPVPAGALVEYAVTLDRSYADPFDPGTIAVGATFAPASGPPVAVDGFWFQDYVATTNAAGAEILSPSGAPHFRVRFRALRAGDLAVSIRAADADGDDVHDASMLSVQGPDVDPFVRRAAGDAPGFARGGAPWVPFGANVCWSGAGGTHEFATWFDAMAVDGLLNWSRLWMTHFDGTALEWKAGGDGGAYAGVGAYNPKAGWRVDRILDLASTAGIALQLVLQQHSQFQTTHWSSWDDNPWNAANGGPCATSMQFFTDPDVVAGFDRRLRYLVARYAHAPALMAWELWNEVDLIQGYDRATVDAWSRARVALLRSLDPYGHLVTTSYAMPEFERQDWAFDGYDLVQLHNYVPLYWDVLPWYAEGLRAFGKPVVLGEFGIDVFGAENLRDADGTHLVNATLLAVFSGFAGGAMSWWWDNYLHPLGLWEPLRQVARVLGALGVSDVTGPWPGVAAEGDGAVVARAARTADGALVWLHDVASEWDRDPAWTAPTHAGVTVRVDGIAHEGQACGGALAWGRPWTGGLGAAAAWPIDAVDDGGVRFVAPAFARDLVMRVTCAGGPLPESGEASTADMAIPEGGDAAGEPSAPADVPVAPEPGPETPDAPAPADASPDAAIADPPVRRHAGGCSARF
jgi:hypothetical protein